MERASEERRTRWQLCRQLTWFTKYQPGISSTRAERCPSEANTPATLTTADATEQCERASSVRSFSVYETWNNFPLHLFIGRLPYLRALFLPRSTLVIPAEIGELKNIVVIEMVASLVRELPREIGRLETLRHLNLSGGILTDLPTSIGNLRRLVYLNLRYNRIIKLPYTICKLTALRFLDVSYNTGLSRLPEAIGELTSLEELKACYTGIDYLPSSMTLMTKLEKLDIGNTLIRGTLPEFVIYLPSLKSLRVNERCEVQDERGLRARGVDVRRF